MLENILNDITRLPMDRLGRNLAGHIPSCARHVRYDAVAMECCELLGNCQGILHCLERMSLNRHITSRSDK